MNKVLNITPSMGRYPGEYEELCGCCGHNEGDHWRSLFDRSARWCNRMGCGCDQFVPMDWITGYCEIPNVLVFQ